MQQDELVKLIKKHLWHKVKSFTHRGELISVYAFTSRLKSTDFPVKVFVVFNNTSQEVRTISTSLKGKSINECKQALLKLILFSFYQALRKNNANITLPPH